MLQLYWQSRTFDFVCSCTFDLVYFGHHATDIDISVILNTVLYCYECKVSCCLDSKVQWEKM